MAALALQLRDQAIEVTETLSALASEFQGPLLTGTIDDRGLRHVRATLAGVDGDIRDIRRSLDSTKFRTRMRYERGDYVIAVWRWERALRRSLVVQQASVKVASDIAERIELGRESEFYVTRKGDTLQKVAARFLGDFREWPRLLRANTGLEPGTLEPGTVLTIPAKR